MAFKRKRVRISKNVTLHAFSQVAYKGAPLIFPKQLKRRKDIQPDIAAKDRKAFRYFDRVREEEFVYIVNQNATVLITVLTEWEYKNYKKNINQE